MLQSPSPISRTREWLQNWPWILESERHLVLLKTRRAPVDGENEQSCQVAQPAVSATYVPQLLRAGRLASKLDVNGTMVEIGIVALDIIGPHIFWLSKVADTPGIHPDCMIAKTTEVG
jgi:hypothetical protein